MQGLVDGSAPKGGGGLPAAIAHSARIREGRIPTTTSIIIISVGVVVTVERRRLLGH